MTTAPQIGPPHHVRLTVTDVARSRAFYTGVLGFDVALEARRTTTRTGWSRTPCRAAWC
ncbi:VOC family protein [Geodermatophilus sp. DSM 44513]|uniref:VOC family protein n=1 Tax=Geodermatophilus sp. DSM 44513 TaxID=1528104 RepID=UPI001286DFF9|nr:VOC family protein [Geodermatophilus sp. DSM 44513]WNV74706.1 VOC family protein [Geodermatophilus sp. DSM 44513]